MEDTAAQNPLDRAAIHQDGDRVQADADRVVLDSAALARLLEEVRNDGPSEPHAYNRMHNRHNR